MKIKDKSILLLGILILIALFLLLMPGSASGISTDPIGISGPGHAWDPGYPPPDEPTRVPRPTPAATAIGIPCGFTCPQEPQ